MPSNTTPLPITSQPRPVRTRLTKEALGKLGALPTPPLSAELERSPLLQRTCLEGSSGADVGSKNSDITLTVNGVRVGLPPENGQRISIKSKGVTINFGVNGREREKEHACSEADVVEKGDNGSKEGSGNDGRDSHFADLTSQQPSSRLRSKPARSRTASKSTATSKSRTTSPLNYKHREGECWVCDKYGMHINPAKGKPVPTSPPQYYIHRGGECWICDYYGQHIDLPMGTSSPPPPPIFPLHPTGWDEMTLQARPWSNRGTGYGDTLPANFNQTPALSNPDIQYAIETHVSYFRGPSTDRRLEHPPLRLIGSTSSPFQTEGKPMELPMIIHGKQFSTQPDTGCAVNAITVEVAAQLKCSYSKEPKDCPIFKTANGKVMTALGRTKLQCSFVGGVFGQMLRTFYIFPTLATDVSVIMGKKFLDQTKTLTKYRRLLRERTKKASTAWRVMKVVTAPQMNYLQCYLDSHLVLANADTGSEIDLISRTYATYRGFDIKPVGSNEEMVEFANGSVERLSGKTRLKFDTIPGKTTVAKSSQMAEVSSQPMETRHPAVTSETSSPDHYRTFYILDTLTCSVLLGESLLNSINAFTNHQYAFVDDPDGIVDDQINGIWWHRKKKNKPLSIEQGKSMPSSLFFSFSFFALI
jgi:hypothetical protein